ncbi:hypothetical protein, partial [Stenotrophomonas maltophilia]
ASPTGGRFDYQTGLYLLKQEVSSNYRTLLFSDATAFFLSPALPSAVLNGVEADQFGRAEVWSAAVFGQGTWRFTDKASLTVG